MKPVALLLALSVAAQADWVVFRSGAVEVYTDGSNREARQVLATFDQLQYMVGRLLGKHDIAPMWPHRFVMVKADRATAKYRTGKMEMRRDGYVAGLTDHDSVPAAWLRDYAIRLIREDTAPLPAAIEQGLADLLSTIEVSATRITLGTPPDAARRTRDWARIHLLCVKPEYFGRVRVFFSNLQQGASYDVAYRNGFERDATAMEAEVDRYFKAGQFTAEEISGKPLNPERDYRARPVLDNRHELYLADLLQGQEAQVAYRTILNRGEKTPGAFEGAGMFAEATANGSESAMAWLNYGESLVKEKQLEKAREAYRKAAELNARWAEPHARLAAIEEKPGLAIGMLKRACELEPRNLARWLALAEAQLAFKDYEGAGLSWRTAERAAPTQAESAAIEARRKEFEQRRIETADAERRRQEDEKARELAKVKEAAMASIREAEIRARAAMGGGLDPKTKVVPWWDDKTPKQTLTGALEKVDCLRNQARLVLRASDGKPVQLLVSDPGKVVFSGAGGDLSLGCGVQKPARRLKIEYVPKVDAKLGTVGEAAFIEFLQ
jgi:tetratricopeptide (TPR) repeat protein